jgi:hypothetical protein
MVTVVPPARGAAFGRTAVTDAGAGAAAMTFGGVVQVPVTLPIVVIVRFRLTLGPVDTDGTGDPVPAVKLTADPVAVMGGWFATTTVEGMV